MSDLFTDVMSASAASSAAEAASASKAAAAASEERLEGAGHNPFISFADRRIETCLPEGSGFIASLFGTGKKKKLGDVSRIYSIKLTDISYMVGRTDDFGTPYTRIFLEERCNLRAEDEIYYLDVAGTLEETQSYINSK